MNQYLKFFLGLAVIVAVFSAVVFSLQPDNKSMEMTIGLWRIATSAR